MFCFYCFRLSRTENLSSSFQYNCGPLFTNISDPLGNYYTSADLIIRTSNTRSLFRMFLFCFHIPRCFLSFHNDSFLKQENFVLSVISFNYAVSTDMWRRWTGCASSLRSRVLLDWIITACLEFWKRAKLNSFVHGDSYFFCFRL